MSATNFSGLACAAVAAAILMGAPAAWSTTESTAPEIADFELVVRTTDSGIEMDCKRGCGWEQLSFGADIDGKPQAVDQCGMADEASCGDITGVDAFEFTIQRAGQGVQLVGLTGTAWKSLSFTCLPGRCNQALDAMGMSGATSPISEVETPQSLMDLMPADTVSNAEVFDSNGFQIGSSRNKELDADLQPNGSHYESLLVTADNLFKVAIEKGRPMSAGGGVGIFHRTASTPMLSVADQSGDGRIDMLSYSVTNGDGKAVRQIFDYDADGQANFRVHFDESFAEIWHADRWHRIENRDGQRGIVLDGEFRQVESLDNRLSVK